MYKNNLGSVRCQTPAAASGVVVSVLAICLWFGILAGLAERLLYSLLPRTVGGNDLWYAGLADLLLFLLLSVPLLFLTLSRARARLTTIAFFSCAALLALDCLLVFRPPFGHRMIQMVLLSGGALLAAALATVIFSRYALPLMAFVRLSLPILGIYAFIYLAGGVWWARHQEKAKLAALQPRANSPNVLLIIMDAVGANHLSTYGYTRPTSPHLSELASRGLLFEKAVAPSSWTLPSHASMLTGRLPSEHHAGHYDWRLNGRFPTLAELFQNCGYRTAAFSGNTLLFNRRVGFARGYIRFEDGSVLERLLQTTLAHHLETRLERAHLAHDLPGRQNAQQISRNALAWIRAGSGPFFVTINYFDAHEPLLPPLPYFHHFSTRQSPLKEQLSWPNDIQLSLGEVKNEVDAYDASIAYMDAQISYLLEQMEGAHLLANTIVVVTSDHGQEFQEHGFMFHSKALYWNLLHAPLLISWPGHTPAGERVETPVALQSLPATLLGLAGLGSDGIPGPSLADLWTMPGAAQTWPFPLSELAQMGASPLFPSYYGEMKSVVTPQWHFVDGGKSGQELYACCDDEKRNLAGTALGAPVASSFRQLLQGSRPLTSEGLRAAFRQRILQGALKQLPGPPPANKTENITNRERMNNQLRALGYAK